MRLKVPHYALSSGLFAIHKVQRVDLRRQGSGYTSGIYRCEIDTNAAHNRTIFVGLYTSEGQYMLFISVSIMYLCRDVYVRYWYLYQGLI